MKYHLGVFTPGWIDLILDGRKTIESRFTKTRCAPFNKVREGDVVFMKESGGDVLGKATVSNVETYENISIEAINKLFDAHYEEIFCDVVVGLPEKWRTANHATLLHLTNTQRFAEPVEFKKRDRRAWVVFDQPPIMFREWSEL